MKFELESEEVKQALFNHLRKQMTSEDEVLYLRGKAKLSITFDTHGPSKLNIEIVE